MYTYWFLRNGCQITYMVTELWTSDTVPKAAHRMLFTTQTISLHLIQKGF